MSCGDEIAEDRLLHERGVAASGRERGGDAIGEVRGEHEVAEAERREENFAEAASEEDQAVAIESLESGDGTTGVAEFTVVIVFQNQRAEFAGGFEELQATGKTHGDSQRKLMAGCDVDEARAAQSGFAKLHALVVQRDVRNFCAERLEDGGRAGVSGIFHADAITGIEKEARDEVESFLGAGDDGDLIGGAIHATRGVEVVADSLAERQVSERIAAHQEVCGDFTQTAAGDLRPERGGEQIEGWEIRTEGARGARSIIRKQVDAFGVGGKFLCAASLLLLLRRQRRFGVASHLEQFVGQSVADVRAGSRAGLDVTFGFELFDGVDDGAARQAVLGGEVARGGKAGAGVQAAFEDGGAQDRVEPAVGRDARIARWQSEFEGGGSLGH